MGIVMTQLRPELTNENEPYLPYEEELLKFSKPVSIKDKWPFLKSMLYGHKKTGKTILSCQVTERPLLLAADAGWVSLRDWPELSHVEVVEYQGLDHFKLIARALKDDSRLYREFDHIIFDPISTAIYDHLSWMVDNFDVSSADTRVHYIPKRGVKEPAFETTGWNDYNAVLQKFRPPIYRLGVVPKDITYICHVKDPATGSKDKSIKPNLPAAVYSLLAKEVGIIGYMEANGDKRTVSLRPSENQEAGSWIRALHNKTVRAEDYPTTIRRWKEGTL